MATSARHTETGAVFPGREWIVLGDAGRPVQRLLAHGRKELDLRGITGSGKGDQPVKVTGEVWSQNLFCDQNKLPRKESIDEMHMASRAKF